MEIISKLGVDWKLLLAQLINFGILLFLLWKFAYRPVLDMLQKRSNLVEKSVEDAKKIGEEMEKIKKLREETMLQAEKEATEILERARKDAEGRRREILGYAEKEIETLMQRTRQTIEEEKQQSLREIRAEAAHLIVVGTERLLEREFSEEDEKRLLTAMKREMKSLH